jgi:hypothetical protein
MFRSSYVDHNSEEISNSFDGQINICVEPFLCTPSA